jgi:hypothetical protein
MHSVNLSSAVKMWPTPCATEARQGLQIRREGKKGKQQSISTAAILWQTPNVPNGGRVNPADMSPTGKMPDGRKRQVGLENQAKMVEAGLWPTPTASAQNTSSSYSENRSRQNGIPLADAVRLMPTPTARDWKNATASEWDNPNNTRNLNRYLAKENEDSEVPAERLGQLNPDWVEWLMGLPTGWTDVDVAVEHPAPPIPGAFWPDEPPDIPRVAIDIAYRADRLKCLGNMVVPQQFFPIFKIIHDIEIVAGKGGSQHGFS